MMNNIYTQGEYLAETKTWHAEDSPWKAEQIAKILNGMSTQLNTIAEVGCGAGSILDELSKKPLFEKTIFEGFDISPQAYDIAKQLSNERLSFFNEDIFSDDNKYYDLLMAIDVFEHVPDYMGFVSQCRKKARYKVYHIPLDIHVSSVLRNAFVNTRYTIGHIHYFTADSALCTIKDTGHEILDVRYTKGSFGVFKQHPTLKKAIANVPRWIVDKFSESLSARLFGGYSLLVLAK